jgi:hypothetical protein
MERKIGSLMTQKVRALSNIDSTETTLTVSLRLENGFLRYTFHGPLKFKGASTTVDDVNQPGQVDLAGHAAIGTLPQAKIIFAFNPTSSPGVPPQTVTLQEAMPLDTTGSLPTQ